MSDVLHPPASTLVKVGSLVVHFMELEASKSKNGNWAAISFDTAAIETLLKDKEVVEWLREMTALGMLPVRR